MIITIYNDIKNDKSILENMWKTLENRIKIYSSKTKKKIKMIKNLTIRKKDNLFYFIWIIINYHIIKRKKKETSHISLKLSLILFVNYIIIYTIK